MFRIADGREHFYQWDLDRQVIVEDSSIVEVHFCNRTDDCSLVVEVKDGLANVPNVLLQSGYDIRVFGYDGKATFYEKKFKVCARTRPADYAYDETEVVTVNTMIERANQTLEMTNEALENTEEALRNTEEAVNIANEAVSKANATLEEIVEDANEAVELANTANDRANTAIVDVERFANEAKESAEIAQAATVNYYTKEEQATNYSDAKEVAYLNFSGSPNWEDASEEYCKVFDRLVSGEQLTVYIRSMYNYAVADINITSKTQITFRTHFTDFIDKNITTITEYTAMISQGRWQVKEYQHQRFTFATEAYVDEAVDKCATQEDINQVDSSLRDAFNTAIADLEADVANTYATKDNYVSRSTAESSYADIRNGISDLSFLLLGIPEIAGYTGVFPVQTVSTAEAVRRYIKYKPIFKWTGSDYTLLPFESTNDNGLQCNASYKVDADGNITRKNASSNVFAYTNRIYLYTGSNVYEIENEDTFKKIKSNTLVYDNTASGLEATTITKAIDELAARPSGGSVDLTGYATEEYVNEAIAGVDVDLTGYATEEYVNDAIANIEVPAPDDVNLTNYYTKSETDAAIQTAIDNIDIPEGGGGSEGGSGVKILCIPSSSSKFTDELKAALWEYINTYEDNGKVAPDDTVFYVQSWASPSVWLPAVSISAQRSTYGTYVIIRAIDVSNSTIFHYAVYFNTNGTFQRMDISSGDLFSSSEWTTYSGNQVGGDIYSIKEIFIKATNNNNSSPLTSYVIFDSSLGNATYIDYPLSDTINWYFDGWNIQFNDSSVSIDYYAIKE